MPVDLSVGKAAPAWIVAADGTSTAAVAVTWQRAQDAVEFRLYRRCADTLTPRPVTGWIADTLFADSFIVIGKHYEYAVAARFDNTWESPLTLWDDGFARLPDAPGQPDRVTASGGAHDDRVVISWLVEPGVHFYTVYRSERITGPFISIGTVFYPPYDDKGVLAGPQYYTVSAYNRRYQESEHSAPVRGFRAVTNHEYLSYYDRTIKRSHEKLTMIGEPGWQRISGDVSGSCEYDAGSDGPDRAKAVISYRGYCDREQVLNGIQYSSCDWSGNCRITGRVTTTGIYEGSVEYHLKVTERKTSGGFYRVQQKNKSGSSLPFDWWTRPDPEQPHSRAASP